MVPQNIYFQLGPLVIPAQHLETVVTRTSAYIERNQGLQEQCKSILLLFEYRRLYQERGLNGPRAQPTLVRIFLDLTRQRFCRDSRDRIYGILGIFESVKFIPDYTVTLRQVYQDFVSQNLEAGDFSILHECCIGIPNADEQSYVPFFGQSRSQTKYTPFADPSGATYCAGLHQPSGVRIDADGHISIQGFFVDTVQQKLDFSENCDIELDSVGRVVHNPNPSSGTAELPLRGTWGAIYQTILGYLVSDPGDGLRWRKDYEEHQLSPQYSQAPYPHNSLFDVLVRAMRTDLNADYDWLSSKGQIRTDSHLRRQRREVLQERSLFWTKTGFIGTATCHLEPGDEVVVFNGDTTPFLLRKQVQLDDKPELYKIVSDCYLFGWMYGPYPDRTVATDPSRRGRFTNKLKGVLDSKVGSSGEGKALPSVLERTYIIS